VGLIACASAETANPARCCLKKLNTCRAKSDAAHYDPEIADAFARLGAEYDDLAARLSEGDPAFEARFPSGAAER